MRTSLVGVASRELLNADRAKLHAIRVALPERFVNLLDLVLAKAEARLVAPLREDVVSEARHEEHGDDAERASEQVEKEPGSIHREERLRHGFVAPELEHRADEVLQDDARVVRGPERRAGEVPQQAVVDVDLLVRADIDVVIRDGVEDEDSRSILAEDAPILRQVRSERVETLVEIPRGAEYGARYFAKDGYLHRHGRLRNLHVQPIQDLRVQEEFWVADVRDFSPAAAIQIHHRVRVR